MHRCRHNTNCSCILLPLPSPPSSLGPIWKRGKNNFVCVIAGITIVSSMAHFASAAAQEPTADPGLLRCHHHRGRLKSCIGIDDSRQSRSTSLFKLIGLNIPHPHLPHHCQPQPSLPLNPPRRAHLLLSLHRRPSRASPQQRLRVQELHTLNDFLSDEEIRHQYSDAYTPQQNGVTERKKQTLMDIARSMLTEFKSTLNFWAEAISTTYYLSNRLYLRKGLNKTPYEVLSVHKPNNSFFKMLDL
jgi:hypothetical protein